MKRYDGIVKRELLKHRKRSVFTLLGIILGIAIFVFLGEVNNFKNNYGVKLSNYQKGDTHFVFRNISGEEGVKLENNSLVDKVGFSYKESNTSIKNFENGGSVGTTEEIYYADKRYFENILVKENYSLEGRFPESEDEVIIGNKSFINKKIGDKISISGKDRIIVGFIKDTVNKDGNVDIRIVGIRDPLKKDYIMTHVRLKSDDNIVENAEQIGNDIGVIEKMNWAGEFGELVTKRTLDLNIYKINLLNQSVEIDGTIYRPNYISYVLSGILGIALIILTYIAINSSAKEKRKTYSILKCMGASNGQVRKLVLKESIIMAILAIIPGVVLGEIIFAFIRPSLFAIEGNKNLVIPYEFNFKIIILATIIVFFICIMASLIPMIWIGKLSPIDSLREEKLMGKKRRIRSSFVRKILGYEAELSYKSLRVDKSNFIGMTLVMIIALVIFNIFTGYYRYEIYKLEISQGVLERDLQARGLQNKSVLEIINSFDEYGDYSKYELFSDIFTIEGIEKEVLKDTQNYAYVNEKKNEIISKVPGVIAVIDDKGFNDLIPYIEGSKVSLENFKNNGVILFSNGENSALHPPLQENKVKLNKIDIESEDASLEFEGNKIKNPELLKSNKEVNMELNLLGTMYFEAMLGPRLGYQPGVIGVLISEDTAKELKITKCFESVINYEFENDKKRENHLEELEKKLNDNTGEEEFYQVENLYEMRADEEAYLKSFAKVMYTMLGYILLMIILSIVNIRDIVLNNRKKEFGIMFAVGMDKKMLRKSLIYEGVIQGIVALTIGNLISFVIFNIIQMTEKKFVYSNWIMVISSVVIIIVTILNTLNAIRRLSSDKPVEMIKSIE